MARRFDQQSTLGSYLDPLADKVLICSVVAALGIQVLHACTTAPALGTSEPTLFVGQQASNCKT